MFEITSTSSFNASILTPGTEYDYVTRTSQNQGVLQTTGFVNENNLNEAGVWSLGLLQMDFFYRRKKWYAGQFVRKVIPKITLNDNAILFFTVLLNKCKKELLSVLVRNVDDTFKNLVVKIPITTDGIINYAFMDSFINELEQERINELNAYLNVTGLANYTLTEEEENVLKETETWKWNLYNLKYLYGPSTRGKRLKSADRLPGKLPFVTAGEAETGISAYISNNVDVFPANTTTIDMFGSAKYRNYEYGADDHVAVVHTEFLPKHASIFVTSAIHKASHTGKFDYGNNFYASDADELYIKLPTKNGSPDYTTMATYIRAIEKLVIKEVVKYSENKVSITKSIYSNNNS